MSILLLSAILFSQPPDTAQPVLTWEPQMPAWGDTITFIYHHMAPNAKFKGAVPLLATSNEVTFPCERQGDVSRVKFLVPHSVSRMGINIHTIEDLDWSTYTEVELTTPEGWFSMEEKLEMLRRSFGTIDMGYTSREEAKRLLDSLRANPSDDTYYRFVCMYGFLKLGKPDSAWAVLSEMEKKDKGTSKYSSALDNFSYEILSGKIELDSEQQLKLNRWIDEELVTSDSASWLTGITSGRWAHDSTHLTPKQQTKILEKFAKIDPRNIYVCYLLIKHYLHLGDTVNAEREISAALRMNLSGTMQKEYGYGDTKSSDRKLSSMMLERGKIRAAQGRYDQALADFSFVILLKDDYEGEAFFERAKVWQRLERYKRAEGSFIKALKAGYVKAEPALKGIYLLNYGKVGYEEYLTEKLKPSEDEELRMTADFGFKDLEGNPGQFFDYRGKIVVINYWGLGCSPCKVEIPWLNELVEACEGTGVEFLAFSFDEAEAQKDYFKDHPFEYTNLIPDDRQIFSSIGLSFCPLPWHAVIDPQGRVRFTRIGGCKDNSDIKLIIDQLLREQAEKQSK